MNDRIHNAGPLKAPTILGGIIGDVVGSRFEFNPVKTKQFDWLSGVPYREDINIKEWRTSSHFTDDTVLTIAVAQALLDANGQTTNLHALVVKNLKDFGKKYPWCNYDARLKRWLCSTNNEPYHFDDNSTAIRISAVPYFADNLQQVKDLSRIVSETTHLHPASLKGAEATAVAIWLALHKATKDEIKQEITKNYYQLDFEYDALVKQYATRQYHDFYDLEKFPDYCITCQDCVPQAIYAFLIANDYEDAVRTAVALGGAADSMANIAGAIAGAYYGIPDQIKTEVLKFLPAEFQEIITKFEKHFNKIQ